MEQLNMHSINGNCGKDFEKLETKTFYED